MKRRITREYDDAGRLVKEIIVEEDSRPAGEPYEVTDPYGFSWRYDPRIGGCTTLDVDPNLRIANN